MKTNLIIVEGLPGSGKSTTAAMIADEIRKKGKKVVCIDEGAREHPADFADYDFPDFETERRQILQKWRSFVAQYDHDTLYVFNCIFLQNPMCETMMRFGLGEAVSQQYIAEIAEEIRPLNPMILYIHQPDVRAAIDGVLEERGNDWLNAVMDYHVSQGYGKQRGLVGYEGYIQCLEERKIREQRILKSIDIDDYSIGQDMGAEALAGLFESVGWNCPDRDLREPTRDDSARVFIVRHRGSAVAAIRWLVDAEKRWLVTDLMVHKAYQGKMIGTLLYRFSENSIRSTLKEQQKVCIEMRAPKGMESFFGRLGFRAMGENKMGKTLEKSMGG